MTEAQLQKGVLQIAKLNNWRVAHFKPGATASGRAFITPVAADGKGFPDLTMVRGERLIFAELKQDKKYPGPEQRLWLDALRATGAEVYVWRPSDYPFAIAQVLA